MGGRRRRNRPGVRQPTTATSHVANTARYDATPDSFKAAPFVAAREVSAALRQHVLAADGVSLQRFVDAAVERHHLAADDMIGGRGRAVEAWRAATRGDALATGIRDSQIAFMEQLGPL
jgi:hypothetical protein